MSIIYDALKKVQDNTNTPAINKKEEIKIPPPQYKKPSGALIIFFLVILGIFLGKVLFGFIAQKEKNIKNITNTISAPSPIPQIGTQDSVSKEDNFAISTPLITTLPALTLNGVFFTDNQAYVLINNQVFKENDIIKGAKITAIKADSVDLIFEGRNFTLRVE